MTAGDRGASRADGKTESRAQVLARLARASDDPYGWFEHLYREAGGDPARVPWAELAPNPHLLAWAQETGLEGRGRAGVVVGCGLGDDAAALAELGFNVTAFDVSPTAIKWCRQRLQQLPVDFQVADLFALPGDWRESYIFALEAYTLQALPADLRRDAAGAIAGLLAPGGTLLVLCWAREPQDPPGTLPWPLTRRELAYFTEAGLHELRLDEVRDADGVRLFRAVFAKRAGSFT